MTKIQRIENEINRLKRLEKDETMGDLFRTLKRQWIAEAREAGYTVKELNTKVRVTAA